MAEEESGAWGSVDDTRDVIVRLTGQQTNHATSKLLTLYSIANIKRNSFNSDSRAMLKIRLSIHNVCFVATFWHTKV